MRIFCFTAGKGGVGYYRIIQPYTYISKKADVFIYDPAIHDLERLHQEKELADVIVMQMPFGEQYWREIQLNKKKLKPKLIVLEFDDNIFNIHPMNPSYRTFGQDKVIKYFTSLQDMRFEQAKFKQYSGLNRELRMFKPKEQFEINGNRIVGEIDMWKDGEDGFILKENQLRMDYTKLSIAHADLITCSTKYLGQQLRKHRPAGDIAVLPNLLDLSRWKPIKHSTDGLTRIFWSGGSAHYQDLFMVRKALWEILDKYPKVKIAIKGAGFEGIFKPEHKDRVEWVAWHSDINTYPLDIAESTADIGICPVIDDPFNRSKSELKWLEFSAMKIPTVCSKTTYSDSVSFGKTGYIANNHEEWVKYLSMLIESPELRDEIAEKAYTRVSNFHNVERSDMWYDLISDKLLERKGVKYAK